MMIIVLKPIFLCKLFSVGKRNKRNLYSSVMKVGKKLITIRNTLVYFFKILSSRKRLRK